MLNSYNRLRFLIAMIGCLVLGGVLVGIGISRRSGLRGADQISEIGLDVKDGQFVKGVTEFVGGYYCYETSTKNGKTTETFRWYMVGYESTDASGNPVEYFIGVKVPAADFSMYQQMSDSTENNLELSFQGKIKRLEGQQLQFRDDFVREIQSEQKLSYQLKDYTPDFYIELMTTKQGTTFLLIGLLLFGVGVVCVVATILSSRKSSPYADAPADSSRASFNGPNGGGYGGNTYNPYGGTTSAGSTHTPVSTDTYNSTPRTPYMPFADENGYPAPAHSAGVPKDELDLLLEQEDQKVSKFNANVRRNNDQNNGNDLQ